MEYSKQKLLSSLAILGLSLLSTAQASLIDRGGGMIYDDILDVTWLQDANYAQTSGYSSSDRQGRMNWHDANTWANNLIYGDYNDWRLPTLTPRNGSDFDYRSSYDNSTDGGTNLSGTHSELAYMFHTNLGNISHLDIRGDSTGCSSGNNSCLVNTGPFSNLQRYDYWFDTEWTPSSNYAGPRAWVFRNDLGSQTHDDQRERSFAWAVRSGDSSSNNNSSAVPVPATLWLFGGGLVGLIRLKRKVIA